MKNQNNNNNKFKTVSEEKIELLLKDAVQIPCNESTLSSKIGENLPEWFDKDKFERGQKYFHDNIFAMLFAKFAGLLTILIRPTILKILQLTNQSSTPLTAYKRYMATIFHMTIWYDEDFKAGSDLWKSIRTVRNLHFSASRRALNNNLQFISQADMVITQFGFMGYILTKPRLVGIYDNSTDSLEGFIHVWRVVGYLLGIEDRFNLCSSDSIEETREYCNELVKQILAPKLTSPEANEDFHSMSFALVDGMSVFQPFLNYPVAMKYIYDLCDLEMDESKHVAYKMNLYSKFVYNFTAFTLYTYRWLVFRMYHNILQHFALYSIIKYFPFLAYFKFGFKDAHLSPVFPKRTN